MTAQEKAFAAEKHDFVFQYLRMRRLTEDHYDVVIEAYIGAVRAWLTRPELHRYSFEGVATKMMDGRVRNHYEHENWLSTHYRIVRLDAYAGESQSISFSELIPDQRANFCEAVEQREIITAELKKLPRNEAAKLIDFCSVSSQVENRYLRKGEPNLTATCACGCGGTFPRFSKRSVWRDYLPGHQRRKEPRDNPLVPCKCGCGEMIHRYNGQGRHREYIRGHNLKKGKKQTANMVERSLA